MLSRLTRSTYLTVPACTRLQPSCRFSSCVIPAGSAVPSMRVLPESSEEGRGTGGRNVRRLRPRGEGDGRSAGDDLLAALVLCPHLELHEVDVVLRRLGEDATPAGHDVLEPHERGEADAELLDRARARPVGG